MFGQTELLPQFCIQYQQQLGLVLMPTADAIPAACGFILANQKVSKRIHNFILSYKFRILFCIEMSRCVKVEFYYCRLDHTFAAYTFVGAMFASSQGSVESSIHSALLPLIDYFTDAPQALTSYQSAFLMLPFRDFAMMTPSITLKRNRH